MKSGTENIEENEEIWFDNSKSQWLGADELISDFKALVITEYRGILMDTCGAFLIVIQKTLSISINMTSNSPIRA